MKNKQKLINLILKEVGKINNETLEENKSKQTFETLCIYLKGLHCAVCNVHFPRHSLPFTPSLRFWRLSSYNDCAILFHKAVTLILTSGCLSFSTVWDL